MGSKLSHCFHDPGRDRGGIPTPAREATAAINDFLEYSKTGRRDALYQRKLETLRTSIQEVVAFSGAPGTPKAGPKPRQQGRNEPQPRFQFQAGQLPEAWNLIDIAQDIIATRRAGAPADVLTAKNEAMNRAVLQLFDNQGDAGGAGGTSKVSEKSGRNL